MTEDEDTNQDVEINQLLERINVSKLQRWLDKELGKLAVELEGDVVEEILNDVDFSFPD